jgi:hypothetical protein
MKTNKSLAKSINPYYIDSYENDFEPKPSKRSTSGPCFRSGIRFWIGFWFKRETLGLKQKMARSFLARVFLFCRKN